MFTIIDIEESAQLCGVLSARADHIVLKLLIDSNVNLQVIGIISFITTAITSIDNRRKAEVNSE